MCVCETERESESGYERDYVCLHLRACVQASKRVGVRVLNAREERRFGPSESGGPATFCVCNRTCTALYDV